MTVSLERTGIGYTEGQAIDGVAMLTESICPCSDSARHIDARLKDSSDIVPAVLGRFLNNMEGVID